MTEPHTTFEDFFIRAEPLLRRALVSGFGADLGRDATAEALTYGWSHWDRVAGMENPTGYLYRVGERWARRRRIRSRRITLMMRAPNEETGFEPGLGHALDALPRRQRQAVTLVHGLGLTHAEAAQLLGVSRSTIQNHVERGLAALRNSLGVES